MPHALPMLMCAVFMVYGFSTTNPKETIWYACMILIIMRLWMWKQHPGIFLYLFLIQFIESHTAVMEANNFRLTLNEVYPGSGEQTFLDGFFWTAVSDAWHASRHSPRRQKSHPLF